MTTASLLGMLRRPQHRPPRPLRLPCGSCRRRTRHVGLTVRGHSHLSPNNNICGGVAANSIAKMRSARHRFAIATALLAYLVAPLTSFTVMALQVDEELSSDLRWIENLEKDSLTASNDNGTEKNVLSANNRERNHKCCRKGCPRDKVFWKNVMGSTFFLNATSYLLCTGIIISKRETNQQRRCLGGSVESTRCVGVTILSAIASMAVSLLTTRQVYAKASELMMMRTQHVQTMVADVQVLEALLALFGFIVPIILIHKDDFSKSDLSVVTHEDVCPRCETICKKNFLSRRLEHLRDEYALLVPPSRIILRSHAGDCESTRSQRQVLHPTPTDADETPKTRDPTVWLAHLFIHGSFVGAAAILACPCDGGTFLLMICAIALSHGVSLERATMPYDTSHDQHKRCWIVVKYWMHFLSLLALGGFVAVKVTEESSSSRDLFMGSVLASVGGAYINMALSVIMAEVKQHCYWIRPSDVETIPTSPTHCSRLQESTLEDRALGAHCTPCTSRANPKSVQRQTPSAAQPIPQRHLQHGHDPLDRKSGLAKKYDLATWNMYALIVSAREARAKSKRALRPSVKEEDEETATVTVGATGEEKESESEGERRLVQTCPYPLYLEADDKKEAEATETSSLRKVHQEWYHGATGGHMYPRRKHWSMSGESLLFQLEL